VDCPHNAADSIVEEKSVNWPWTHYTDIICVTAAVRANLSPSIVRTAVQWRLWTLTSHVVQPDFTRPSSIVPISNSFGKTELSTCNLGVIHTPATITHCSPLVIVADSYNTSNTWTYCTRLKFYVILRWTCESIGVFISLL